MVSTSQLSIREAALSSALHGAFVASPRFLSAFLSYIGVPRPELVDNIQSQMEYSTGDSSSRIDIYLWREDPALKIALEIKRAEDGLREDQLRDYLSLLKITQDGRLQKRREAPRNAKLIVITGATQTPEEIEHIRNAAGGKLEAHIQWVSWYRLVDILDEVIAEEEQPNLRYLSKMLSELGYVSADSALPALRTHQKILSQIMHLLTDDSVASEMEVLTTTLSRVEYEMGKLGYGVEIRLTKSGRKLTVKRQRIRKLKSFDLFGGKIYTLGRAFLPLSVIQTIQTSQKSAKRQDASVGIAYSIPSRSWVAFILPKRGHPLPNSFIDQLATRNRIPIDPKVEGFVGWLLKGDQKRPRVVARFLKRVWEAYEESFQAD